MKHGNVGDNAKKSIIEDIDALITDIKVNRKFIGSLSSRWMKYLSRIRGKIENHLENKGDIW